MPDPDDSGPASVPSSAAPIPQSGVRIDDEDAPPSSGPVSTRDADEGAPPSSGTYSRVYLAIMLFASSRKENEGRDFVIRVVKESLGNDVGQAMLEDIVQGALAKAVECRWPPWTEGGVPPWLARLTRREIADYFRKELGRKDAPKPRPGEPEKREPTARPRAASARNAEAARLHAHDDGAAAGRRVEPAESTDWVADHRSPPTDERARARFIHDWLAKQIGDDPRKVRTLELLKEHEVDGFTLAELAAREKTTERALANRFHKLRQELGPKVRLMDDEKTRRSVILMLLFFGGCMVVAFVLWLLGMFARPAVPTVPALRPVPSVTVVAPEPVFNQAFPTTPSASANTPSPPEAPEPPGNK